MSFTEFIYCVLLGPKPLRIAANWLLRRMVRERVVVGGASLFLNPRDPVVSGALTLGVYEREEIAFFRQQFKPGMTFVDVGANVGLYTALAIRQGAGCVLAVEPHGETFEFLRRTAESNSPSCPVILKHCAAGKVAGEMPLYCNPDNKGDNRLYPDPLLKEKRNVPVSTLDALCLEQGIRRIDFLKIDVQGAEMCVLEGAAEILRHSPGCVIMTEFWPQGLKRCGSEPESYIRLLAGRGGVLGELRWGRVVPVDWKSAIRETSGRQYRNFVVSEFGLTT